MDTIFARSTAPGRAGIAVVRISGPNAWACVVHLTDKPLPAPRALTLRNILCDGELVDIGMVVLFEEHRSFTGEMSAELHLHGSESVVRRVLGALAEEPDTRPAGAGEFTHRALLNNKMDLSEVEGLGALLQAETEAQRKQAVHVLNGAFRSRVERWREELKRAVAQVEVAVDFADEDIPDDVMYGLSTSLIALANDMREEASSSEAAEKIARGFEVAIVGAPNVGKSTLLNRLAGREAALTSEIAGTTRDVLEVRMEVAGQLVTMLDTAGLRETDDRIERAGVSRAQERARGADVRIFIDTPPDGVGVQPGDILVRGKADLDSGSSEGLAISGKTGEGIQSLLSVLGEQLADRVKSSGITLTARQAAGLRRASEFLIDGSQVLAQSPDRPELVSEHLRNGIRAVDEVVGRIGVEDVLGEIFSQFCIGK